MPDWDGKCSAKARSNCFLQGSGEEMKFRRFSTRLRDFRKGPEIFDGNPSSSPLNLRGE
jgi:hypothetical protein